jgi:hypothetical protein
METDNLVIEIAATNSIIIPHATRFEKFHMTDYIEQTKLISMNRLADNLKYFDFLHCKMFRTRKKSSPIHPTIVRVAATKDTVTLGICVTARRNTKVTKSWTPVLITNNCLLLLFGL